MAPRDFSEDGALGAGLPVTPGDQTGGMSMSDPGPSQTQTSAPQPTAQSASPAMSMSFMQGGGGSAPAPKQATRKTPNDYPVGSSEWQSQFIQDTTGITHPEFLQNTGGFQRVASFSEGGAVGEGGESPDDDGAMPQSMDGLQQSINQALATVDNTLSYGRKLHGLPSGDEGGGMQTAGAMPMIPGNQSETPGPYKPQPKVAGAMPTIPGNQSETPGPYKPGQPRPQKTAGLYPMPTKPAGQSETGIPPAAPGPGTLPPTNNPFGKRADSSDGDDDTGAIPDNDEDVA